MSIPTWNPTSTSPGVGRSRTFLVYAAALFLCLAVLGAYANSFQVPFLLDDHVNIEKNPTIHQLWPIPLHMQGPLRNATVDGRPFLNFSFAVDYALYGNPPWGYHVTNLAIHLGAALLLFGWVRRTLLLPGTRERYGEASLFLAFTVALLWALHPLDTLSVTYLSQRAESMASFFYLATLYGLLRGATSANPRPWFVLACSTCLLGIGTKEIVATAPVMAFLYDRTFLAGSFRQAWKLRGKFYLSLLSSWVLLGYLLALTHGRHGVMNLDANRGRWEFIRTEFWAVGHYLKLALWPSSLIFDYGSRGETPPGANPALSAVVVLSLVALTLWALRKRPAMGFAGAWFFVILAPTSSVLPVPTRIAEYRTYLPLAGVVALFVLGAYALGKRSLEKTPRDRPLGKAWPGFLAVALFATALGGLTFARNNVYHSEMDVWQDTVQKLPDNASAHGDIGTILLRQGKSDEAMTYFQKGLRLDPKNAVIHYNTGTLLQEKEDLTGALEEFQKTLALDPNYPDAHYNIGVILAEKGDFSGAVEHYALAAKADPDSVDISCNLGGALYKLGRLAEARQSFEKALALEPDAPDINANLGNLLLDSGNPREALPYLEKAFRLNPSLPGLALLLEKANAGTRTQRP